MINIKPINLELASYLALIIAQNFLNLQFLSNLFSYPRHIVVHETFQFISIILPSYYYYYVYDDYERVMNGSVIKWVV